MNLQEKLALVQAFQKKQILDKYKPTMELLNKAAYDGELKTFIIYLECGLIPTYETMENSCITPNHNEDIFVLCVKHLEPNINILDNAALLGYTGFVRDCIEYGIKPTQETLQNAIIGDNSDIFMLCIQTGIHPDSNTIDYLLLKLSN